MSEYLAVFLSIWLILAGGGRASAAGGDPMQRAVAWLHGQQLSDGGFGILMPDGTSMPSASATADAIYVLASVGENPAGPAWKSGGRSALDALAALAPSYVHDAGQAGKIARAVASAGGNPRSFAGLDLVRIIRQAYDPTTGRYDPALLYRHTLAMEGLLAAGEVVPPQAYIALLRAQRPNGGWFWSFDGPQTDVDSTGRVLQVLATQEGAPDVAARAANYLYMRQEAAGGWSVGYLSDSPNANSTALAVAGLRAAGYDPQSVCFQRAGRSALETLLSYQESSGAFVYIQQSGREESRLMATVDALTALVQPLTRRATAGLASCPASSRGPGEVPGCRDAPVRHGHLRRE